MPLLCTFPVLLLRAIAEDPTCKALKPNVAGKRELFSADQVEDGNITHTAFPSFG